MRQMDQRLQRRGGRQISPSSTFVLASSRDRVPRAPHFGGESAVAPVVPGVTRSARNVARHGALVPLRQQPAARHGPTARRPGRRPGSSARRVPAPGRVRGRPCRSAGRAPARRGVPGKTFRSDDTPSAYGSLARCSVRRNVALSPNSHRRRLQYGKPWRAPVAAASSRRHLS